MACSDDREEAIDKALVAVAEKARHQKCFQGLCNTVEHAAKPCNGFIEFSLHRFGAQKHMKRLSALYLREDSQLSSCEF